jgi:magnesium chelatase accessory protein
MDWHRDLPTWPLHHLSRRIPIGPHRWHVQETGKGDTVLLIHGAGATTHSWRDVIPWLAPHYHVVTLDLPGQGFTQSIRSRSRGLAAMSEDILSLCAAQAWKPSIIIGHSAGAAIALHMGLALQDSKNGPAAIVGINAALGRFEGVAGWLFPLLAKFLALNPLTSYVFSSGGQSTKRARRLIERTGTVLTEEGIRLYARLISDPAHVNGTLQMMAQWDIDPLLKRLVELKSRSLLLCGENDRAVSPAVSKDAAREIATAKVIVQSGLGHLSHEESPKQTVLEIRRWLNEA